jgi:hypothetical protein
MVGKKRAQLTVLIGDAPFGTSLVRLDETEIDKGTDITGLVIGRGPELLGRTLFIKSNVGKVRDETNHTSVRYVLTGGQKERSFDVE